jgi:hypothetical protein
LTCALLAPVAVTIALAGLPACSRTPARTVANFCSHYVNDKARYIAKYNSEAQSIQGAGQNDPLAGLAGAAGMSAQMLGSMEEIFSDLAKVAPDDIQTQVEQVRDSVKKQEDALNSGTVLGALLGSLTSGLESSDSWQQVGQYIETNCHTN